MNKSSLFLSFILSCFFIQVGYSNEKIIKEFEQQKDKNKVSFFRSLSNEDKEENILYFDTEFQNLLKKNSNNIELKKQYIFTIGLIKQIQNKHLEAISKFNYLIENKDINLLPRERIDIYVGMQESYLKLNLYSKVFDVNKKINTLIANGIDYPLWSYNIQSRLYLQLENYDKAIEQLKKEIKLLYSNSKRDSLIIPSAFNDLGYYHFLKKDYKNAIFYYNESIHLAEIGLKEIDTLNYRNLIENVNNNICNVHLKQKKFEAVVSYFLNKKLSLESKLLLAEAYIGINNTIEAGNILNELSSKNFEKQFVLRLKYLELINQYFNAIGNYKESNRYLIDLKKISDSLAYIDKKRLLESDELNYFIEEKEQEGLKKDKIIKENEKVILVIVIISLIIILFISFYFIANTKKKKIEIEKMNQSISKKNKTIQASLKEKELLLQEIHHRVKNNLQVISGILSLQNSSITDEKSKQLLAESQDRIQAIALLHKTMYQNDNYNIVDFKTYISQLITYIKSTNKKNGLEVTVIQNIEEINFSLDTAIPLSILLNEIITNSYKHAFTALEKGVITITIKKQNIENYTLSIKDNGIGLPKNYHEKNSMGFDLIYGLSEQINGNVNINCTNGTEISIEFKDSK